MYICSEIKKLAFKAKIEKLKEKIETEKQNSTIEKREIGKLSQTLTHRDIRGGGNASKFVTMVPKAQNGAKGPQDSIWAPRGSKTPNGPQDPK